MSTPCRWSVAVALLLGGQAVGAQGSGNPPVPTDYWEVLGRTSSPSALSTAIGPDPIATALLGSPQIDTSRVFGPVLRQARRDRGEPAAWAFFAAATLRARVSGPCSPIASMAMRSFLFGCRRVYDELRDAIRVDSAFAPALLALDAAVPYPLIWDSPERALGLVTAALQRELPDSAARRLLRLRTLLAAEAIGDPAAVREAIAQGRVVLADGEYHFLVAQAAAANGDARETISHYTAAAASDDAGEAPQWIARDVGLVGEPSELLEWQALETGVARGEWVARFWSERDHRNGQVNGHRLVEHFERWQTALARYRSFLGDEITRVPPARILSLQTHCRDEVFDPEIFAEPIAYITPDSQQFPLLDDRGMIWMRHGPPTRRVNYPVPNRDQYDGWLYATPEGPQVAFFCRPRPSVNRSYAVGFAKGPDLMPYCEVMAAYCVLEARRSLGGFPPEQQERLRQRGQASVEALMATDSDTRSFKHELAANLQIFGRGLSRRGALVVADFDVKGVRELFKRDSVPSIRWEVLGWDASGNQVLSFDESNSLPRLSADQQEGFVTVALELPVTTPTAEILVVLSDAAGERGMAMRRRNIPTGASLLPQDVSDLLLFAPGSSGNRREWGDTVVSLSPTLSSGVGKRLRIGYVLTGFQGTPLRTSIAVRELGLVSESAPVSISSERTPTADRLYLVQEIDLGRLDRDDYDIILTVTTPDGRAFERRQRIRIP